MTKSKPSQGDEVTRINPARELRRFLNELRNYNGNVQVLGFFSERYGIDPPDQVDVMKRMNRDTALLDRAIRATEAVLGDRADTYLQWTEQVKAAFRQFGMDTPVEQAQAHLGGYEVHLDYCIDQLATVELSEELTELLDLIQEFRSKTSAMNLSNVVGEAVAESLDDLETKVWDRAYGIQEQGGTLVGKIMDRLGRLGKVPKAVVDHLLYLAVRVCLDPNTMPQLVEGAEHAQKLLNP